MYTTVLAIWKPGLNFPFKAGRSLAPPSGSDHPLGVTLVLLCVHDRQGFRAVEVLLRRLLVVDGHGRLVVERLTRCLLVVMSFAAA